MTYPVTAGAVDDIERAGVIGGGPTGSGSTETCAGRDTVADAPYEEFRIPCVP